MTVILGIVIVIACVIGGYMAGGGHLGVLWQPFEFVIILGAGIGATICANTKATLKAIGGAFGRMVKGPAYTKADFLELLCLQYQIFKLAKTKGMLALEQHVENPGESTLFAQFPKFHGDHHAVDFVCDYLRLMSLGADKPHEIESLMDQELEVHHLEEANVASALAGLGDGLPALGIVAAVLGVIHTMGSISEPPEILGKLIGAALVGTFSGILASYGFVAPMASAFTRVAEEDTRYYECLKAGILAHMAGNAPTVSVEYARKTLMSHVRPSFYEVEEAANGLPQPG
ncbi:flagellar motor stator protein MotA [Kiloniella laminariae]|uniref:Flagellar motor stator protein MotA n=1 Tax=Kiloniella laminariae TaxID=454162 RepID=A0ABT4LGD2_9PROT|nr:flagellar motor stator protein MotA [Kiloniella laminariae]MCZ4280161.1 flagellar motor stator protein MotA [Kiloniella laminariae]